MIPFIKNKNKIKNVRGYGNQEKKTKQNKSKGTIKMFKKIVWYQLYVEAKKYKLENITTVKQSRLVDVDNYCN